MERQLFDIIERIANLAASEIQSPHGENIKPVHVAILGYLQRCNVFSDTPSAVAQYLGNTKGTVSQSIRVLERRGYLKKNRDANDRRVQHLALTAKGLRLIEKNDWSVLTRDAELILGTGNIASITSSNQSLLNAVLKARNYKTFGVCHTCRYFVANKKSYSCSLLSVTLELSQIDRICLEHEYEAE